MKNFLLISLLIINFSCTKTNVEVETKTCKLMSYETSNTRIFEFEYSGDRVKSIVHRRPNQIYIVNLTFDNAGRLTQTNGFLNGIDEFTETYSYTEDKITRADITYVDGFKAFKRLEYNTKGQLSKFTYQQEGQSQYPFSVFSYDTDGFLIQTEDFQEEGVYKVKKVVKPMNTTKSAESLLEASGLPYDIIIGIPYNKLIGGDGTLIEYYYPNTRGQLELSILGTVSKSKVNSDGFIESNIVTFTGDLTQVNNSTYTVADCQ